MDREESKHTAEDAFTDYKREHNAINAIRAWHCAAPLSASRASAVCEPLAAPASCPPVRLPAIPATHSTSTFSSPSTRLSQRPSPTAPRAAKTHLTSRVPKLQPDGPVLEVHCFAEKVDADGGLVGIVKRIVHEPRDETRLAHRLLAQKDELRDG